MLRRLLTLVLCTFTLLLALPAAAFACGGLVAGKHAEVLTKATSLAAWVDGIEHYITGFEFAGTADSFGYIIPLPAPPTEIRKGGDWTLERLEREAFPPPAFRDASSVQALSAGSVEVLKAVKIDSLDIKVVRGGGRDVAAWAREHGFDMTPDTDDLLATYKANIFALAKFDKNEAQKKFVQGQGVVIDFEIPLPGPWIPLRILSLGKHEAEIVNAHLFMLTPERPMISPRLDSIKGLTVVRDEWASNELIADLRSDTGTEWIPETMWFTAIELQAPSPTITYDIAALGVGGIQPVDLTGGDARDGSWAWWLIGAALGSAAIAIARRATKAGTA